jgi:hypothetical protein
VKTSAYKVRTQETNRNGEEQKLEIKITIAIRSQNQIAKYTVQYYDSKNVFWRQENIDFGADTLTYSFMTTVKYENKTVQVTENLPGKDFEKEPIL